ncbi:hypothetical protein [Bosea sp. Root381]|uniref:hypothetical protein n=1 Tax=Bosea sp. Root381 TaxID=1736524 RepID=UPI001FCDE533|nr:hypothetical protein [Bosea sp. Root381]
MSDQDGKAPIELRLHDSAQLFNTLDPFPFREGDISADAERYIVEWAQELPKGAPIAIVVHLQQPENSARAGPDLAKALRNWFAAKARAEAQALRDLFRDGRLAFLIGFAGLAICLFLSFLLTQRFEGPFTRVFQESLIIIGWVVIWRPAEMFLYDWVPLLRRRRLYQRLADARITVQTALAPRNDAAAPSPKVS